MVNNNTPHIKTALNMIKDAIRFRSWDAAFDDDGVLTLTREDYSIKLYVATIADSHIDFVLDLDDIGKPFDEIEHVRVKFLEEGVNIQSLISQVKYHYGLYERLATA